MNINDKVYWIDPDNDISSGIYTIKSKFKDLICISNGFTQREVPIDELLTNKMLFVYHIDQPMILESFDGKVFNLDLNSVRIENELHTVFVTYTVKDKLQMSGRICVYDLRHI